MQITEAEWEVMESVWQVDDQLPAEILARIDAGNRSHRTLRTLLTRLVDKGAVTVSIDGSKHYYSAAVSRTECVRAAAKTFAERFFAGNLSDLLLHFVEQESLSADELETLRAQLAAKAKKPTKPKRR